MRVIPEEAELVPFQAGFPPGDRWLLLAPHPDDEALGPGATLALARERGVDVHLVVVTSGAAQGDTEEREAEAVASARELGLAPPMFWRFGDRTLAASLAPLAAAVGRAVTELLPDTIFVTSPVELHPDHRALAMAVQRSLRRATVLGLRRQPPHWVAAYEVATPLAPNLLVAADAAWERKMRAVAEHSSQLAHRPYERVAQAFGALRALTLSGARHAEAFHVLTTAAVVRRSARAWAAMMGSPHGVTRRFGSR
jgi:LmbE family N-acetylglucosaminyl deacetylase